MKFILAVLVMISISIMSYCVVLLVTFNQNCAGYLKRAADANTVETALSELQKSTKYLEDNGLTKGYTSIVYRTPDEDIEFWYNNLKASERELLKVDSLTSSLEKTNLLMKLRETLLDNSGKHGDTLTCPDGLSRYPHNGLLSIALVISCLSLLLGVFVIFQYLEDKFN
jgi:hypothetical protein